MWLEAGVLDRPERNTSITQENMSDKSVRYSPHIKINLEEVKDLAWDTETLL